MVYSSLIGEPKSVIVIKVRLAPKGCLSMPAGTSVCPNSGSWWEVRDATRQHAMPRKEAPENRPPNMKRAEAAKT